MFRKEFLAFLVLFGFLVVSFTACGKPADRIIDRSKYRRAVIDCDDVPHREEICVEVYFEKQTELYCADNDIPQKQCDLIENEVDARRKKYKDEVEKESK